MMNNGGMLDVRRLQVLSAVVETGSVTAAAARLGYTVSSVSQQVSQLEREVGLELLEKVGRGIKPTQAGTVLAEHADTILACVGDAQNAMEDMRSGRTGRVRVASFASAGDSLLPAAVATLRRSQPGLHVATTIREVDEAYDDLRAARIDLAIVLEPFGPGDEPVDGLVRKHLLDDPYRILLPAGHRLAHERTLELFDLADDDWVACVGGNGSCQDDTTDVCRRAGFSPTFVAHAVEFPAAQAYVATGIGVGLAPVLALGSVREGVVVKRLRREPEPRHVWTLTRPGLAKDAAVVQTVRALRDAANAHLAATGTRRRAPSKLSA
jgi:DNA-binding transcriptional LysR family regulator